MIRYLILVAFIFLLEDGQAQTVKAQSSPAADALGVTSLVVPPKFEIFCDFRCPFCARLFLTLITGSKIEKKPLDVVFQHYPFHDGSEQLARFYEAASLVYPKQRMQIIDTLYQFRAQSREANLESFLPAIAVILGFDYKEIKREMRSRDILLAIEQSKRMAVARGVDHTPTLFYKGEAIKSAEPEILAAFILAHSGQNDAAPNDHAAPEDCNCTNQQGEK